MEHVVVIGAGQAGFEAAAALRREGFAGTITLLGDEPGLPYQRPPLSKGYMADGREDRLALRPLSFFEGSGIDRIEDVRAAAIDRAAREVVADDGRRYSYDHLILATGARNATPPIEGAAGAGVLGLRTLEDARTLRSVLPRVRSALVIGGGFIGLEFAAVASSAGVSVTVVEAASRLMSRVVSAPISEAFRTAHEGWGTRVLTDAAVARIVMRDDNASAALSDGTVIEADTLLLATGVVPNVEIAAEAGLAVENGIVVDSRLLTDDPAISAIGDCAVVAAAGGARQRLESVQAATDQARFVAHRLMGMPGTYDAVPWFWSDQRDLKLQIAGVTAGADAVESREGVGAKLAVWCFRHDRLVGAETINEPATHMAVRRILAGPSLTRTHVAAADYDARALMRASAGAN